MLMTLVLVLACFALLGLLGLCVLSPLADRGTLDLLVPVAPVVGAGFVAVVTSWTGRWMSITWSLPIVAVAAAALVVWGVRRGTARDTVSPARLRRMLLGPLVAVAGVGVAAVPVALVGDVNPVSSTFSVDQLYFAGVSTWMTDNSLLPGPTLTDSWVGDSVPSSAPAAETVRLKLRFGQSAVAATLSAVIGQAPMHTVIAVSLLWLLLLGSAVLALASALGASRTTQVVAGVTATSGFFVLAPALEGKNDGLLGASLCLVVVALSWHHLRHERAWLPLAFLVGALIATYSEYLVLLVPAVGLMTLLGPRLGLLHRLNVMAWPWALSAAVVPLSWLWMVQSFKVASRFTSGPNPFEGGSAWAQLRSALGLVAVPGLEVATAVLATVLVVAVVVGWGSFIAWHPARGLLVGLVVAVAVLEVNAAMSGSGYLGYRVAQLSAPALVAFAVIGGGVLVERRRARPGDARRARSGRLLVVAGVSASVAFAAANLASVAVTTSHDRARAQHVPKAFTDRVVRLVDEVGGDQVSVLAPKLTDVAALSLALASEPDVAYPVVPPSTSYLGGEPLWDEEPDRYYVLGPGAHALDGARVLFEEDGYRVVTVEDGGSVVVPFQTGGWQRVTWMRGVGCARQGSLLLALSNGEEPLLLDVGVHVRSAERTPARMRLLDGEPVPTPGTPLLEGRWSRETVTAPAREVRILRATIPPEWVVSYAATFVLAFADPFRDLVGDDDPEAEDYCLDLTDDGSDGYDRELSLMRGPW